MAQPMIGVEFGTSQIKIIEMKGDKVVKFVKEDMPYDIVQDGEVIAWDALTEFMGEVLKKNKLKVKEASLVVPDSLVYIKRMEIPVMTDQQLKVNLPYEFKDFITEDKDNFVYDYLVIGKFYDEKGTETGLSILAVAANKLLMFNYTDLFHKLKVKLTMAAPQCLCYTNLIKKLDPETAKKDFIIIDFGYLATRVNIFSDGVFDTTRTIEIGCAALANKVAEQLGCDERIAMLYLIQNTNGIMDTQSMKDLCSQIAVDVMRAINYYTYEKRENTLETVYVCGGGVQIDRLIAELKETISLDVVPLSSLATDKYGADLLATAPATLGICWNGKQNPKDKKKKNKKEEKPAEEKENTEEEQVNNKKKKKKK